MTEQTAEDYFEHHYKDSIRKARDEIEKLEMDPNEPCPGCKRRPYPVVVVQHCWCPSPEEEAEYSG